MERRHPKAPVVPKSCAGVVDMEPAATVNFRTFRLFRLEIRRKFHIARGRDRE